MRAISVLPIVLLPLSHAALAQDATLPLTAGYYVAEGTPCAEASNATLHLVTPTQFNWPQQACGISEVAAADGVDFKVALDCEATADFPAERLNVTLTIPNPEQFGLSFEGEPPATSNYCAQSALPEPWSTNDLSAMID